MLLQVWTWKISKQVDWEKGVVGKKIKSNINKWREGFLETR